MAPPAIFVAGAMPNPLVVGSVSLPSMLDIMYEIFLPSEGSMSAEDDLALFGICGFRRLYSASLASTEHHCLRGLSA